MLSDAIKKSKLHSEKCPTNAHEVRKRKEK